MNLPERKRRILKAIIENYIETSEPVGSKMLAISFDQPISSATVRNEMSELEELGFLEKPHVSSGRVPSYSAYRFYVNELMDRYRVAAEEVELMRRQMIAKMREMDNILISASRVVSEMTGHASLSTSKKTQRGIVKKCELMTVDGGSSYALVLATGSSVRHKMIWLSSPIEPSTAAVIKTAINLAISENRLDYLLPSMAQSMGEGAGAYELTRAAVEFIAQTEEVEPPSEVYIDGISRLLNNREYHDTKRVQLLLDYISDAGKLGGIFGDDMPGIINVRIGPELSDPQMHDASLVFSTYRIDDQTTGIIGVVAPTRMDYSNACAKLAGFIQAMGGVTDRLGPWPKNIYDTGEKDDG